MEPGSTVVKSVSRTRTVVSGKPGSWRGGGGGEGGGKELQSGGGGCYSSNSADGNKQIDEVMQPLRQ